MAKNNVADWDTDPGQNEDIGGIDIRGTAKVSNFDNALRELMAQIADTPLAPLANLIGAAGSFIRFDDADTAVMADIVGTVSQSGGVPTGALIEHGSNANGAYARWADGTQICVKEITGLGPISTTFGTGVFIDGGNAMGTLPATFISTPFSSISSGNPGSTSSWVSFTNAGSTTTGPGFLLARGTSSANTNYYARLTAIGRWF